MISNLAHHYEQRRLGVLIIAFYMIAFPEVVQWLLGCGAAVHEQDSRYGAVSECGYGHMRLFHHLLPNMS